MAIIHVEIEQGKLAVEVEGEGPLVVCSPGMGDTRDAYAPMSEKLVAAGYRVARFDLRGHGDSSVTFSRYGDEAIAEDYLAVIKALGGGPAILAGASMSGAGALIAAGKEPEQVAGLILIGAFLRPGAGKLLMYAMKVALLWPWGPFIWRSYSSTLWPGMGKEKASERAASSVESLSRPGRWAAFRATVAGADHSVTEPWLGKVQVPALVVIGDADPDWSDPVAEAKWVASNFKDVSTITVPGAGHAPMFEKPEHVTPGVISYLAKVNFQSKGGAKTT